MKTTRSTVRSLVLGLSLSVIGVSQTVLASELIDETKSASGRSQTIHLITESEEYRQRLIENRDAKKIQRYLDTDLPAKLKR